MFLAQFQCFSVNNITEEINEVNMTRKNLKEKRPHHLRKEQELTAKMKQHQNIQTIICHTCKWHIISLVIQQYIKETHKSYNHAIGILRIHILLLLLLCTAHKVNVTDLLFGTKILSYPSTDLGFMRSIHWSYSCSTFNLRIHITDSWYVLNLMYIYSQMSQHVRSEGRSERTSGTVIRSAGVKPLKSLLSELFWC